MIIGWRKMTINVTVTATAAAVMVGGDVTLQYYNGWCPSIKARKSRTAKRTQHHDPSPYCWALTLLVDV